MQEEQSDPRSIDDIRQKRISLEKLNLEKLNQNHYKLEYSESKLGLSIMVEIEREAVSTQLLDESLLKFTFEILLPMGYPFTNPQVFCHTKFGHELLYLTDGRDLFKEIIGREQWQIGNKLYSLVQYIPDFIQDMAILEDDLHFVGTFHLGENYNINRWANSQKQGQRIQEAYVEQCGVFQCQEQDEDDESNFFQRYLVITPGVLLLLDPIENQQGFGILQSWASLQSLNKIRRNQVMQQLMTLIFKEAEDKQPWVLNLAVQGHSVCLEMICRHLQTMGANQKESAASRQIQLQQDSVAAGKAPKQSHLTELEVSQKGVESCEIDVVVQNMQVYEQEMMIQESTGSFELSTIQTLIKLYQQAIEYYSASDDPLYKEVFNRMQMLMQRPEINAILNPTAEGTSTALSLTDHSGSPGKKRLSDTVAVVKDKGELENDETSSEYESEEDNDEKEEEVKKQEMPEQLEQIPDSLMKEDKVEEKPAAGGFSIGGDESDEEVEKLDD